MRYYFHVATRPQIQTHFLAPLIIGLWHGNTWQISLYEATIRAPGYEVGSAAPIAPTKPPLAKNDEFIVLDGFMLVGEGGISLWLGIFGIAVGFGRG